MPVAEVDGHLLGVDPRYSRPRPPCRPRALPGHRGAL